MPSYEDSIDEYILHLTELALYSNTLIDDVVELSNKRLEDLEKIVLEYGTVRTKRRYQELLNILDEGSPLFTEEVSDILSDTIKNVVAMQVPWVASMVAPIYKGKVKEPSNLIDKINLASYDGKISIQDYPTTLSSRLLSTAQGSAKSLFVFSLASDLAASYIKESQPSITRGIQADIPTITDAIARTTEQLMYGDMASVKQLVWVATLDGRTCIVCASCHGRVYDKSNVPMLPVHHRCRCFVTPYKDGYTPPSYTEWLARQTEETQKKILGKTRFELYKGGMKLDRFVSNNRKLRLEEIT